MISIIIPCYNRLDTIRKSLESLKNSVLPQNTNITIVDDHSTEDILPYLKQFKSDMDIPVTIIQLQRNSGCGIAFNAGLEVARKKYNPEFIMICDSDFEYKKYWLQKLFVVYHTMERAQIPATDMAYMSWSTQHNRKMAANPKIAALTGFNSVHNPHLSYIIMGYKEGVGVKIATGLGNALIRLSTFDEVGDFTKTHVDWGWIDRAYDKGYYVASYIPSVAQHIGEEGQYSSVQRNTFDYAADFHYDDEIPESINEEYLKLAERYN